MATRDRLVEALEKQGVLKDARIKKAFMTVDMTPYLPEKYRSMAYEDRPVPFFDDGTVVRTVSAPHMLSILLHNLELKDGQKILVLGSKSGYLAALINCTVQPTRLIILEANPKIFGYTKKCIGAKFKTTRIIKSDPLAGLAREKPYDRILITGQVEKLPVKLTAQLAKGGFIIMPVGTVSAQKLVKVTKDRKISEIMDVVFGPLELVKRKLGKAEQDILTYRKVLESAWADGMLTGDESKMLELLRKRLKIGASAHLKIEEVVRSAIPASGTGTLNVEGYIARLDAEIKKKDNGMARAIFEEIMQLKDDTPEALICKSVALHMAGMVLQSLNFFDAALKLDRKNKLNPPTAKMMLDTLMSIHKETGVRLRDPKLDAKQRKEFIDGRKMQEQKITEYAGYLLEIDPEDEGAMNAKLYVQFKDGGMDGYA